MIADLILAGVAVQLYLPPRAFFGSSYSEGGGDGCGYGNYDYLTDNIEGHAGGYSPGHGHTLDGKCSGFGRGIGVGDSSGYTHYEWEKDQDMKILEVRC